MSDKLPRIQAIIEATEDVLQRYADKEVKTIAMATAYEHIREITNDISGVFENKRDTDNTSRI